MFNQKKKKKKKKLNSHFSVKKILNTHVIIVI
jgi:hypothetical protein